jgi:indolepyruvate ferredoxin oxidoreductase
MSTADFVKFRDASLNASERVAAIAQITGKDNLSTVAANDLAEALLGNTIYANVLMVGYAWQIGLLPVSVDALLRAIELNGVDIEQNREAFNWGRIAAADPGFVASQLKDPQQSVQGIDSLDEAVSRRAVFLASYQDDALANRYRELVDRVQSAETAISGGEKLAQAVARAYFKTLAYKDEYEVARLFVESEFLSKVRNDFGQSARLRFHLAPPVLGGGVDSRGRPVKREFGSWVIPAFRLLTRFKGIRGSWLDPFGKTAERRMERALIGEFEAQLEVMLASLTADKVDLAVEIANEYLEIRGYGPVKEQAATDARARIETKLSAYNRVTDKAA